MAPTRCAHFESNRAPEPATAATVAATYDISFAFYYCYAYAYQAMLEVRSSGD